METRVMSIDEAKKTGAMALFGEKYGRTCASLCRRRRIFQRTVRRNARVSTGDIGLFRITRRSRRQRRAPNPRDHGFDAIERFREDEN
jgi:alanyl-tRNA synthetase